MTSGNGADPVGVAPGSRWAPIAFPDVPPAAVSTAPLPSAAPGEAPLAGDRVVMP